MDPYSGQQSEIYKLVRENNKMLHAMRRNAFWGGLFKFVIYAIFFLGPLWFYMTYLNGTVQQMLKTVEQVQGTGVKAQEQLGIFQELLKQLESKLPAFMRASTSTKQ
jgi:hypothetical protein